MRTASFLSLGALASALLLVLAQAPTAAGAIKDTIKNRLKMAEQFLEENPVEDSIEATARPQMAQIKNPAEVVQFKRNLESIDYKKLHNTLRHTMVKHFTAPELEYMLEMYSQPLGRAVMAKMGNYAAEITPRLHEAMQPIIQSNADFMAKNILDMEAANGGVHPAAQGKPDLPPRQINKADLPPRHVKVPDGVYQGSTVQDVLDKTKAAKKAKPAAAASE